MTCRRVHNDARRKRNVILYLEEKGNRVASRKFDTDETNKRRWRKQRDMNFACKSLKKLFIGSKKSIGWHGRRPHVEKRQL
ncbi:hypothetical protein TNCV_3656001 [Trichonephila clavipes]|nr:hypothetical protein TNCV_3656001 [Trichonephila clavipes]